MDFQEKLRLAIELSIKVNGKERGAISMLAKSIGVSRHRIDKALKRNSQYGAAGFEQRIDAFIVLNK
jgi:hypothetical protein